MDMEVSRRDFMKGAGGGIAATTLGALGFGDIEAAYAAAIRPFKLANYHRNPQHLPLLRGGLRHHHVFERRSEEGRESRDHRYRGRRGSSDQPRHALPEGRGAARLRACSDAPPISEDPQARLGQVRAGDLGGGARSNRAADEGRPRQELHRQEQRRRHRQPLAHHRFSRGVGDDQRNGVLRPTRWCAAPACWRSTTRRASDTAPRWPVWPQHSAVAQ